MDARQAVPGGSGEAAKGRRTLPIVAESAAAAAAAAESAAMPAGWEPSRFFEAWKREVADMAGYKLCWLNMGHYRVLAPDDRQHVIDRILRTTIASKAYDSDDFCEGVIASHNDYEAMQAYAAAFVDAFWADFWADRLGAA